jgi:hypothetical protein
MEIVKMYFKKLLEATKNYAIPTETVLAYREVLHKFIDWSEPETQRQATQHACLPRL